MVGRSMSGLFMSQTTQTEIHSTGTAEISHGPSQGDEEAVSNLDGSQIQSIKADMQPNLEGNGIEKQKMGGVQVVDRKENPVLPSISISGPQAEKQVKADPDTKEGIA